MHNHIFSKNTLTKKKMANLYVISSPRLIKQDMYILWWANDDELALQTVRVLGNDILDDHICIVHKFNIQYTAQYIKEVNIPRVPRECKDATVDFTPGATVDLINMPIDELIKSIQNPNWLKERIATQAKDLHNNICAAYEKPIIEEFKKITQRICSEQEAHKIIRQKYTIACAFNKISLEIISDVLHDKKVNIEEYAKKIFHNMISITF